MEQNVWGSRPKDAARAYEEAFDWLALHGLVAREPSQSGPDWFFVTERGWDVVENDSAVVRIGASERLGADLHPRIAERVRNQFLIGEVESAVLMAMREVEIRVRELSGADESEIGVNLMKKAFKPSGLLADPSADPGEQEATMALFWGAIGVFKNPSSHREVDFTDEVFAIKAINFADLLLRMLDQIEQRLSSS